MSAEPDVNRIVRSWLEEGRTALPDRVLDAVLDQLPATPQRRAPWPARRFDLMTHSVRLVGAAAAVVAVAVLGVLALPRLTTTPGTGQPSTAAPSPTPSPSGSSAAPPAPLTLHDGPLQPGRYAGNPIGDVSWRVTVPAGFSGFGHDGLIPVSTGPGAPSGMGFAVLWATDVYSDPCHGTAADIATGLTADGLIAALRAQPSYRSSSPKPVTVGGYRGTQIDVELPTDVDFTTCTNNGGDPTVIPGTGAYFLWKGSGLTGYANIAAQGPGNRFHIRAIDVGRTRVVVLTQDFPRTSSADLATMATIVESVELIP